MFTQYLHPQLVLFGQFTNNNIKCKHQYQHKDAQIIVHQVINRAAIYSNSLVQNFMQLFEQKRQEDEENEWDDQPNRQYQRHDHYHGQQDDDGEYYDEEDGEQGRGYEGYFDEDTNPYADQVYGMTMDAQYMPQQLNELYQPQQNKKKKGSLSIPFQGAQKKKSKKEQQQQQDDEGWITQEQQEYYVNEQLEQAAGSFAAEFVPEALD